MKKYLYIDVFLNFLLCFITHSFYDHFKNSLTLIFFPVNESIWEHGKMIVTATLIIAFAELLYFKFRDIKINNLLLFKFFTAIMSVTLVYLFSFYNNIIFHITLLLLSLSLAEFTFKFLLEKKEIKYSNILSLILIILTYIIYGYLTYQPLKTDIFLDKTKNSYGVDVYGINPNPLTTALPPTIC